MSFVDNFYNELLVLVVTFTLAVPTQFCNLPAPSLTCVQKGVSCSGVKIFNGLPSNIQNYKGDRRKFKKELHKYLTVHSFYSITEFLECRTNKRNV